MISELQGIAKQLIGRKPLMALCSVLVSGTSVAKGVLETPAQYNSHSGISAISGWHCTSTDIEVLIDGKSIGKAGTGTLRKDTIGVCGHANTGFSLLVNYGSYTPGLHKLTVLAGGETLDEREFLTARITWDETDYARGLTGNTIVENFPAPGDRLHLAWVEAQQGFSAYRLDKVDIEAEIKALEFLLNKKYTGSQRVYDNDNNYQPEKTITNVEFSFELTNPDFVMKSFVPVFGNCTFTGDIEVTGNRAMKSQGDYNCQDGKYSGTYNISLDVRSMLHRHLQGITQFYGNLYLRDSSTHRDDRQIILSGLSE